MSGTDLDAGQLRGAFQFVKRAVLIAYGERHQPDETIGGTAADMKRERFGSECLPINLPAMLSGRAPQMNIVVLAGDNIYVP